MFNNKLISNVFNYNWNSLNERIQDYFYNMWTNLIKNYTDIAIIILSEFNNYYDKIGEIKDYKIIKKINMTKQILLELFNNNNFEYIYEFLLISLNKLKNTPYYFYLFDNNNIFVQQNKYLLDDNLFENNNLFSVNGMKLYYFNNSITYNNQVISYKKNKILKNNVYLSCYDIYLFSKKLYENINTDNFYSSSFHQQIKIKNFFQNKVINKINNNTSDEISNIINFGYLCVNSFEITFLTLCRLGLLSEFKSNNLMTDYINNIKGKDLKEQELSLKNNLKLIINSYNLNNDIIDDKSMSNFKSLYKSNYYYVNNTKYENLLWLEHNKNYFKEKK